MDGRTDEQLMTGIAHGDVDAFAALYDRHSAAACAVAQRLLGPGGPAEDAVQDVFLSLWWTAAYDPARGTVRSFLLAIVRNRAIDLTRRARRHAEHATSADEAAARVASQILTDAEAERREEVRRVRTALTALPPEQLTAIELAYFAGLTQREIAQHLQEPIGTIKSRVRLGLEKLHAEVAPALAA